MANPIYKIKQKLVDGSWDNTEYPIGASFSEVRDDDDPTLSLKIIMDSLLKKAHFIKQGSQEPTSKNVKVWYDTTEDNGI